VHDIEPAWDNNDINDDHTVKERNRAVETVNASSTYSSSFAKQSYPSFRLLRPGRTGCMHSKNDRIFKRFSV